MFDQLNDLPHDLVRERLLDARRERLALQAVQHNPGRLSAYLGDILIVWGMRLKHQTSNIGLARREQSCSELVAQELVRHKLVRG